MCHCYGRCRGGELVHLDITAGMDSLGHGVRLGVTLGTFREAARFLESLCVCAHSSLSLPLIQ